MAKSYSLVYAIISALLSCLCLSIDPVLHPVQLAQVNHSNNPRSLHQVLLPDRAAICLHLHPVPLHCHVDQLVQVLPGQAVLGPHLRPDPVLLDQKVGLALLVHCLPHPHRADLLLPHLTETIMTFLSETEITTEQLTEYFGMLLKEHEQKVHAESKLERDLFNSKLVRTTEILINVYNEQTQKNTEEFKEIRAKMADTNLDELRDKIDDLDLKNETYASYQEQLMYNLKQGLYKTLSTMNKDYSQPDQTVAADHLLLHGQHCPPAVHHHLPYFHNSQTNHIPHST